MLPAGPFKKGCVLLEPLDDGRSRRVWLAAARDPRRDGRGGSFAIKRFEFPTPDAAGRLVQDFALTVRQAHPNVVPLFGIDVGDDGQASIAMEVIDGTALREAMRGGDLQTFVQLAAECLRGLGFLSRFCRGHGHLSPGNLRVRTKPRLGCRVVLLDPAPGFATDGRRAAEDLLWAAPETLDGSPAGRRSDLYSLGALLFDALHGKPPVKPREKIDDFIRAAREGRRSHPALPDGSPAALGEWLDALLAPDPRRRPASPDEALADLAQASGFELAAETPAGRAARLAAGVPCGRGDDLHRVWDQLAASSTTRVVVVRGEPGNGTAGVAGMVASEAAGRGWYVERLSPGSLAAPPDPDRLGAPAHGGHALLVLDDLHEAGESWMNWLDRLLAEPHPTVRVLATLDASAPLRPGWRRRLDSPTSSTRLTTIELGPVSAESVRESATACGIEPDDALVRRVRRRAEARSERIERELFAEAAEAGEPRSPEELLDPGARGWLSLLRFGPTRFTEQERTQLAGLDQASGDDAAVVARSLGLARLGPGGLRATGTETFQPARDRPGEVGAAGRYRAIAEALEARADRALPDDGRWTFRAWLAAGLPERARQSALAVADGAAASQDPWSEALSLRDALTTMGRREGGRPELRLRRAEALLRANCPAGAARGFAAASRPARAAEAWLAAGRTTAALSAANRALAAFEEHTGRPETAGSDHAIAALVLGTIALRRGHPAEGLPHCRDALEFFDRSADDGRAQTARLQLAGCEEQLGRAEATDRYRAVFESPSSNGAARREAGLGLARRMQATGDHAAARSVLEIVRDSERDSERDGDSPGAMEEIDILLASAELLEGRLAAAIHRTRESLEAGLPVAGDRHTGERKLLLAIGLARCGKIEEARRQAPASLPEARAEIELLTSAAEHDEVADDDPALDAALEQVLGQTSSRRAPLRHAHIRLLQIERRLAGRGTAEPEDAAAAIDAIVDERPGCIPPWIRARLALARAGLALARGEAEPAVAAGRAAAGIADAADLPDLAALAAFGIADARAKAGDDGEARTARSEGLRRLDVAADRIDDPTLRAGFLDRPRFSGRRRATPGSGTDLRRRLTALYEMSRALNSESDPDGLLESILDMALQVVSAERGVILLRRPADGRLEVRLARNLERQTILDAEAFSESVVSAAGEGRSVLSIDTGADERLRQLKSVSLYGIRSVLCVPLRSRGRIVGAVYLDNRSEGAIFSNDDLRFLEAFADHAALALENARARRLLEQENRRLQDAAEARFHFGNIVGESPPMQRVFSLVERVADNDAPVLIHGESGTGKELVARAVHFNGPRREGPFVSENCAALPDSLLQSELFGHVRGAFTGADRDRRGMFELADKGTLFLDEVGDMSLNMQAQLLRVIQEGEVRRVGGDRTIPVDVRIVTATHRDLERDVASGRFRQDLLYRLQVLMIELPPLRDRGDDLDLLIDVTLDRIADERGRPKWPIEPEARARLAEHAWPGNVRELHNVLERLCVLAGDGPILRRLIDSDSGLAKMFGSQPVRPDAELSLSDSELGQVRAALEAAQGNRARAAKMLGISRSTLYRRIRELEAEQGQR